MAADEQGLVTRIMLDNMARKDDAHPGVHPSPTSLRHTLTLEQHTATDEQLHCALGWVMLLGCSALKLRGDAQVLSGRLVRATHRI